MIYIDKNGEIVGNIPQNCLEECTKPGEDAQNAVEKWIKELKFYIEDLELARNFLKEFGAWEVSELSEQEVCQKVFWIMTGDLVERGEFIM